MAKEENIIYLFDESGRAILSPTDPHIFLDVGVLYKENEEGYLFTTCDKLFRLSTKEPLKNANISDELVQVIANKIVELNIPITCIWIDLNDKNLVRVLENYRDFLIELRRYHNLQGNRKIAHILHDRILDKNIFEILDFLSDISDITIRLKPYIDMWPIPSLEKKVKLISRSNSIEEKIKEITHYFEQNISFKVEEFKLLENKKNKRKRFIDIITSIVSRAFIKVNDSEYICDPSNIYPTKSIIQFIDYTQEIVVHTNRITDDFLKNNPVI